jgi:hypothetical protein
MKQFFYLFLLLNCISCNQQEKIDTSNDVNCAEGFIKSIYNGKFKLAETVILQNNENDACLKKYIFTYNQFITKELKEKYKVASIIFNNREVISDSISIFNYKDPIQNRNQPKLKLVKLNNIWKVDFAYSCSGNL